MVDGVKEGDGLRKPVEGRYQRAIEYHGEIFTSYELPVSRENEATYVIPVYREYGEGNIVRLLGNLAGQDISKNQMEVVLLVNNRKPDVVDKSAAFVDNQMTLRILAAVQGRTELPDELKDEEKMVLQSVIDSGLRINYVDMTTTGIDSTVIGEIRQLGVDIAARRSEGTLAKDEGMVFNFDADSMVSSGFTMAVMDLVRAGADVVITDREWIIPGEVGIRDVLDRNYATFNYAYSDLQRMVGGYGVVVGTLQIVEKLKTLQQVGGIPRLVSGEDYGLMLKTTVLALEGQCQMVVAPNLYVETAFRRRDDNPHNFDSKVLAGMKTSDSHMELGGLVNNFWEDWLLGKLDYWRKQNVSNLGEEFREYAQELLGSYAEGFSKVDFSQLGNASQMTVDELKSWVDDFMEKIELNHKSPFWTMPNPLVSISRLELTPEEYEKFGETIELIMDREGENIGLEIPEIASDVRYGVRELTGSDGDQDCIGTYAFSAAYIRAFNLCVLRALGTKDESGFKKIHEIFTRGRNVLNLRGEELNQVVDYLGYKEGGVKPEDLFATGL